MKTVYTLILAMPYVLVITLLYSFLYGCTVRGRSGSKDFYAMQYVNPYIGTSGYDHVLGDANMLFEFVQLSLNQYARGWDWCSSYHYSNSIIIGFRHMHLSGTGTGELGDVSWLPVLEDNERETLFIHANGCVKLGYYYVRLKGY